MLKVYGILLAVGGAYFIWVLLTGKPIPCYYYTTFGVQCPGCGSTRMVMAMARLQFAEAFSLNPVMFFLLPLWNLIALLCLTDRVAFVKNTRFLYTLLYASVAALLILGLVRIAS